MFTELDELIRREMERARIPGLAIALVKDSEIVWSRGYGYADLETETPVTPSTVFSIQSVTKPIVTTAFMQWYERGTFDLDGRANEVLAPVRIENEWEETAPVTIRHLLTHTSGLPVDITMMPAVEEGKVPLEEYVASVVKTVRPPGEEMIYANWGYDIIGHLTGRFAGQPYDRYLREHVLQPLGMHSSVIEAPDEAATGYFLSVVDGRHHAPEPVSWPTDPPRPAGALFSTVEDLGRFLIAHLNGGVCEGERVLQDETVAEMHKLHARSGPLPSGMGLGFRVDRTGGRDLFCHGGDGVTFTAFIGAFSEEKLGVALLINLGRAQTTRSVVANAALRSLAGDYSPREVSVPGGQARSSWAALEGRYISSYWGTEATLGVEEGVPFLNVEGGIVTTEGGERSCLQFENSDVARAFGGPFDGFELAFETGDEGGPRFFGGLYPFRFDWQGPAAPQAAQTVDERADLTGRWEGTVASPLGPVPLALTIAGGSSAEVTVLSADDAAVEDFRAERGKVSGHVDVMLPGFGDFRVFLRLSAAGGELVGRAYAQGKFGEVPMRTELARA